MALTLILARADNGVIGRDGGLPWRLPADLRRFKALTLGEDGAGRPMVMGRKTFESFPAPLPGRRHIVLTRDRDWRAAGAEVVHSIADALALAGDDAFVIGGAEIFALCLDRADRIELTEVHCAADGDVTVPAFTGWREAAREDHPAEGERPAYSFVTLLRAESCASPRILRQAQQSLVPGSTGPHTCSDRLCGKVDAGTSPA